MLINWSESAQRDIIDLLTYFASIDEQQVGQGIVNHLFMATNRLVNFPLSGKLGRVLETREIIFPNLPYVLVYSVQSDTVTIVNVIHTSKQWPV